MGFLYPPIELITDVTHFEELWEKKDILACKVSLFCVTSVIKDKVL